MTENVSIPAEWQQLHWKQQVNLAQSILGSLGKAVPADKDMEASTARAIIDTEAKRQADETRKPVIETAPIKEGERTLDVFLLYDAWVENPKTGEGEPDTIRLRADPTHSQTLPFALAKSLLDAEKARRADPLPGA